MACGLGGTQEAKAGGSLTSLRPAPSENRGSNNKQTWHEGSCLGPTQGDNHILGASLATGQSAWPHHQALGPSETVSKDQVDDTKEQC